MNDVQEPTLPRLTRMLKLTCIWISLEVLASERWQVLMQQCSSSQLIHIYVISLTSENSSHALTNDLL